MRNVNTGAITHNPTRSNGNPTMQAGKNMEQNPILHAVDGSLDDFLAVLRAFIICTD
jgi:hypothetical protein